MRAKLDGTARVVALSRRGTLSKAPRAPSVISYFSGEAAAYRSGAAAPLAGWVRSRESKRVLAMVGPVAGLSVLELGCGTGHYAGALHAAGAAQVVGVDLVPEMLKALPPGVEGVEGDGGSVQLGRRFDRILCAGMLEFHDHPEAVLANAAAHATEQARLVLLAPHDGVMGVAYRLWHRRHGVRVRLFPPARLHQLAAAAGWRPVEHAVVWPLAQVAAYERGAP